MKKIDRNASCTCGSGKKYKQCCLKRDEALAASNRAESIAIQQTIQVALGHQQAGRLSQAEVAYQQILKVHPHHPEARHFLGVIALQTGKHETAIEQISKAIRAQPSSPTYHCNLGAALQAVGRLTEAVECYHKALSLDPNFVDAHNNLGNALKDQEKLDEAAWHFHKALAHQPNYALAHYNLGNVLRSQGKSDEAIAHCHKALTIKPDFAEAYNLMGIALRDQGKLVEAVACYHKAFLIKPDFAEAYSNLGLALQSQGKLVEAVGHCRKALSLEPDFAEAHNNLGLALQDQLRLDEAIASYHQALLLNPAFPKALNNLGNALKDQGRLDEALEQYRKALTVKADYAEAHSNLLFAMIFHPGLSGEEVYRAALEYEVQRGLPLRPSWPTHRNERNPHRRLRVGYVSPDFRRHAVTLFAEPILANQDKSQVEVYCYAEVVRVDEVTGRFRQYADHWYSTVGLSDEAVAQMILSHRIDILVDLTGHTAHNRLLVFARKPAPIQITYLGYPGTTGLAAMDYRITDHYADPDEIADAYYSEHLLRLPGSLCCYRPSADMPEVSPLPALKRGYLTFGSFNNFNKVDEPTLELWAELLRALPTSRLTMFTVPEGEARQNLLHRFAGFGIEAQRLEFHGKLPAAEFYRKFLEVDISLDPVSVSGGTTTCESLWMGVPVMALVGEHFIQRVSYSFLSTAGLADFAAASRADYIRIACHLAENLPLLAEIRGGLREHIRTTPLVDEIGFTSNLENLYREVWVKWCNSPSNGSQLHLSDNEHEES